jgi:hypothetical protein
MLERVRTLRAHAATDEHAVGLALVEALGENGRDNIPGACAALERVRTKAPGTKYGRQVGDILQLICQTP